MTTVIPDEPVDRTAVPGVHLAAAPAAAAATVAATVTATGSRLRGWVPALLQVQLLVSAAAAVAVGIRSGASAPLAAAVLAVWLVGARDARQEGLSPWTPEPQVLVRTLVLIMAGLAVAVVLFGWREEHLRRGALVAGAATAAFVLLGVLLSRMVEPLRVVLVGESETVEATMSAWTGRPDVVVAGVVLVGADHGARDRWSVPVADDPGSVGELVDRWEANVVAALPSREVGPAMFQRLCWQLEGTPARLAVRTGLDAIGRHRVHLTHLSGTSVARIEPSCPSRGVLGVKAVVDRAVAGALLVVLAPLLLLLMLMIRLESPGRPVFAQVRVGRGGELFTMYKLRTMFDGADAARDQLLHADEGNGVLFKIRNDPRVTRLGRMLRKSSLDELPQLVNVLRGDMSLVGPRPALPSEVATYDELARRRLAVLPGMTGLWQVRGRSTLGWDESVALDLQYADNITLGRDLVICVETLRVVATGKGAY